MSERLIITNGSAAVEVLQRAGVAGKVLSWDDVLHDGPVPGGMSPAELREVRAAFLAEMSPDGGEEAHARLGDARRRLAERDAAVEAWDGPVLLWFEHDLYDQLQLIQVLDRVGRRAGVELIQMNDFVTHHDADDLRAAEGNAIAMTDLHSETASAIWRAFTAADPREAASLTSESLGALPYASSALSRWFQMFPGERGLSLTEGWLLDILKDGPQSGVALFRECQSREAAAFRGDWSFWGLLRGLGSLLVLSDALDPVRGRWSITELGEAVQAGAVDRVDAVGIDRWLGGTHLTRSSDWRFIDGTLHLRPETPQNPKNAPKKRS